jgi:hypothetical protein
MIGMTKLDLPRYLKLRKMHGSLYLTVPREYVLGHTLSPHDVVYWLPESDGIKLKFWTRERLRAGQVGSRGAT